LSILRAMGVPMNSFGEGEAYVEQGITEIEA